MLSVWMYSALNPPLQASFLLPGETTPAIPFISALNPGIEMNRIDKILLGSSSSGDGEYAFKL